MDFIDPDNLRKIEDWRGVTGTIIGEKKRHDGSIYYEFRINTANKIFKDLMEDKTLMERHFNPGLRVIFVKPDFLSDTDIGYPSSISRSAKSMDKKQRKEIADLRAKLSRKLAAKRRPTTARSPPKLPRKRYRTGTKMPRVLMPDKKRKMGQKTLKLNLKKLNLKGGFHLYKRLGVTRKATKGQIKKAYQKIKNKKGKIPKRVKEAYRILSIPKTRKRYNNSYHHNKTKKRRGRNQRGCSRKKR